MSAADEAPEETTPSRGGRERRLVSGATYNAMENLIMMPRYGLVVTYIAATLVFIAYNLYIIKHAGVLAWEIFQGTAEEPSSGLLTIVDEIMLSNVIYLIVAGSYLVYVDTTPKEVLKEKMRGRPLALMHLSPGMLKEKMAGSLVSVSSVFILTLALGIVGRITSNEGSEMSWDLFGMVCILHTLLLLGFWVVSGVNRRHEAQLNHDHETRGGADDDSERRAM